MCVQQCICILMLFLLFAIQFHNVSIDHNPNPHLLSPSFIPLFTKKPQELAGKAPRPCSVSSPCHTCCCNGVHHAHSGAPTGWSCKLCKSMEACGQSHRRHSRPVTPSGHQYNWDGGPLPRNLRSWACCGGRHRQLSDTSTRWTLVCGPRLNRSPQYGGTGPSDG